MSQSNSTHRQTLTKMITDHASQGPRQTFTKKTFPTSCQIKMQCVKMIPHFIVHYWVSARALIIITALWLSFLQCYCIQWCADQYLLSRFTTRIVSKPNVSTFPIMFYAQNLSLTVLVTYLVSWVKLNCSPTELQCTSLQAAGWCSLGNTFSAFLHPYHASARKLIGWFLNFGSAHS